MAQNNHQVEHIKNFLAAKADSLRDKIKSYDTPIMQELVKNSPHLQMDYISLRASLSAYEDALLAIDNFVPSSSSAPAVPPSKSSKNGKAGRNKQIE